MKKWLGILMSVILMFGVVGCDTKKEEIEEPIETDAMKFKTEYESYNHYQNSEGNSIVLSIPEDNPMVYASSTDVFNILESGTGIIYFGFPTCPWCRNIVPVLIEVAQEQNIDKVYYFDVSSIRSDDSSDYDRLKEYLNDYLESNGSGEKTLYVPDVYFIKKGEIVGHHLGSVNSQSEPYTALTESQHNELKTIYQNLIKNMQ